MTFVHRLLRSPVFFAATWLLLLLAPLGVATGLRNSLLALVAAFGVLGMLSGPHRIKFPWACSLLWSGFVLGSALWSWSPYGTLKSGLMDVALPLAAMFAAFLLTCWRGARGFLYSIMLAQVLIFATAAGLVMVLGYGAVFETQLHASYFAAYPGVGVATTVAMLAMPFCIAVIFRPENPLLRVLALLALVSIFGSALLSQNRAFWLVAPCIIGLQCALFFARRRLRLVAGVKVISLLVATLLIMGAAAFYSMSLRSASDPAANISLRAQFSQDVRWAAWQVWIARGSENPLLGFGYGKRNIPEHLEPEYRERLDQIGYGVAGHGHNLLLNFWLQTGVVGVFLFLLMVVAWVGHFFRVRAPDGQMTDGAVIGVALIASLFLKNMTDDFYGQAVAVYFWILMGVALGMHSRYAGSIERTQ